MMQEREYGFKWKGNTKDLTGIATITCRDKVINFKMESFEQFNDLCGVIDAIALKIEQRNEANIFAYINSYRKRY